MPHVANRTSIHHAGAPTSCPVERSVTVALEPAGTALGCTVISVRFQPKELVTTVTGVAVAFPNTY